MQGRTLQSCVGESEGAGEEGTSFTSEFSRIELESSAVTSFYGEWVLIAQWDRVHQSPHGEEDHTGLDEDNSFWGWSHPISKKLIIVFF